MRKRMAVLAGLLAVLVGLGGVAWAQEMDAVDILIDGWAREMLDDGISWALPEPSGVFSVPKEGELDCDAALRLAVAAVVEELEITEEALAGFYPWASFYDTYGGSGMPLVAVGRRVWYFNFANKDLEDRELTMIVVVVDAETGEAVAQRFGAE